MADEKVYRDIRFGSKVTHLGCEVLPGLKPINVVITHIEGKEQENVGGQKQDGFNAYVKGYDKPIWLNATNKNRLQKFLIGMGISVAESRLLEKHVKNLTVTLCAEECKDPREQNGKTMGLRISRVLPPQPKAGAPAPAAATPEPAPVAKPKLALDSDNYEAVKSWLCEDTKRTLSGVVSKYEITPDALTDLESAKKASLEKTTEDGD